jgi:hypothetical protein
MAEKPLTVDQLKDYIVRLKAQVADKLAQTYSPDFAYDTGDKKGVIGFWRGHCDGAEHYLNKVLAVIEEME